MEMTRLSERDIKTLAIKPPFGYCDLAWIAQNQLAADQQVLSELFEELETLFIPAYKEGELGVKPPTDWLITILQWQDLKKKYLGEK